MKPTSKWINDWHTGIESSRENAIAGELLKYFMDFWDKLKIDEKSKTTTNRYSGALHALGGYLVEQATSDDDLDDTADELLSKYIDSDGGPLIYYDNESWQDEVDMVCRKIHKHIKTKC
jgi:hypothetical protein